MVSKLMSTFVLLKNPFYRPGKKSVLHVEGSVREEMLMEEVGKAKSMEVSEVGIDCKHVKVGDKVYVDIPRLMSSSRVTLGQGDEEVDYFIVRENDIVFIY